MFESGTKHNCPQCGREMVFFLQHAHGNYPLLDYLCPHCDLGEGEADDKGEGTSE